MTEPLGDSKGFAEGRLAIAKANCSKYVWKTYDGRIQDCLVLSVALANWLMYHRTCPFKINISSMNRL